MIANATTAIIGRDVVLVPYRPEHVETYHKWMLSPELRELTASEPLTLDEEYQMQRTWQRDVDKLTFIVLARRADHPQPHLDNVHPWDGSTQTTLSPPSQEEISKLPMIGDVNLFLKGRPVSEENKNKDSGGEDEDELEAVAEAEAEVMIAEPTYRRKGHAASALRLLFHYATSPAGPPALRIAPRRLVARIGESNTASLRLFERLAFRVVRRVSVFREIELRYAGDGNFEAGTCVVFE